jgi:hypothetical protein
MSARIASATPNSGIRIKTWYRLRTSAAVWLAAGTIVLFAAAIRLAALDGIPPGYTFDEAEAGVLATHVFQGVERPVFFPEFLGQEPLYIYASAGMMALLGGNQDILPLHLTSAAFGILTVVLTFLVGRALFGARVGLFAAAAIAGSFWQVMMSRTAYRSISQVCLEALSLCLFCVAWRRQRIGWYVLAGAAIGATVYTYLGARAFPLVFVAFGIWLVLHHGAPTRAALVRSAAMAIAAAIVLLPLVLYFRGDPGLLTMRTDQVFIFRDAVSHGHPWRFLADNLEKLLASFTLKGEEFWRYSLPGRPMFVGAVAVAFYGGLFVLARGVWRRDDRYALLLITLVTMFLPSVLSWDAGSYTLRSMGLVPAIYLVPALGLDFLWRHIARVKAWGPRAATAVVGLILLADAAWTVRDYFVVWAPSFGAYAEGGADSVAQARFLAANAHPESEDVFVANNLYHNPALSQIDPVHFPIYRWFDGHQDVVFAPWSNRSALYVLGFGGMNDRAYDVFPASNLVGAAMFPSGVDGGKPPALFRAYRFSTDQIAAEIQRLTSDPRLHPVPGQIGNSVVPIGAYIDGPVRAGDLAQATFIWKVQSPLPEGEYQMVAQIVDQGWHEVGTVEGLDWPTPEWHAGDVVWTQLQIPVPATASAGLDRVQVALYNTHTGERVPVTGGQSGIQALVLGEVRVTAATSPPPAIHLGARLGDSIDLVGADSARFPDPGTLAVTLAWSADRPVKDNYTVFVQLLGPDGKLVAQSDGWPVGGNLPTSSWLPGEQVRDEHLLTLNPGLPAGNYRLIAGMYLLSTGQRLPVASGGDFVEIQRVSLPATPTAVRG